MLLEPKLGQDTVEAILKTGDTCAEVIYSGDTAGGDGSDAAERIENSE